MESRYESIIKEIDKMLISDKIDKLLKEYDKQKKKQKRIIESKKIKNSHLKISFNNNDKEEIIELKTKNKKQIIDLYDKPIKASYKKKIIVN